MIGAVLPEPGQGWGCVFHFRSMRLTIITNWTKSGMPSWVLIHNVHLAYHCLTAHLLHLPYTLQTQPASQQDNPQHCDNEAPQLPHSTLCADNGQLTPFRVTPLRGSGQSNRAGHRHLWAPQRNWQQVILAAAIRLWCHTCCDSTMPGVAAGGRSCLCWIQPASVAWGASAATPCCWTHHVPLGGGTRMQVHSRCKREMCPDLQSMEVHASQAIRDEPVING